MQNILKKGYLRIQKLFLILDAGPGQSRMAYVSVPQNFGIQKREQIEILNREVEIDYCKVLARLI